MASTANLDGSLLGEAKVFFSQLSEKFLIFAMLMIVRVIYWYIIL
jgi:hypothetical protein